MGHYLSETLPDDLDFEAYQALASVSRFMDDKQPKERRESI